MSAREDLYRLRQERRANDTRNYEYEKLLKDLDAKDREENQLEDKKDKPCST